MRISTECRTSAFHNAHTAYESTHPGCSALRVSRPNPSRRGGVDGDVLPAGAPVPGWGISSGRHTGTLLSGAGRSDGKEGVVRTLTGHLSRRRGDIHHSLVTYRCGHLSLHCPRIPLTCPNPARATSQVLPLRARLGPARPAPYSSARPAHMSASTRDPYWSEALEGAGPTRRPRRPLPLPLPRVQSCVKTMTNNTATTTAAGRGGAGRGRAGWCGVAAENAGRVVGRRGGYVCPPAGYGPYRPPAGPPDTGQ